MNDIDIIACNWKLPGLLKPFLDSLFKSLSLNCSIKILLNEAPTEVIDIVKNYNVDFIKVRYNLSYIGVDLFLPLLNSKYVFFTNDDMLYHKGWDIDLVNIMEQNYPCSASCGLVEPIFTNNPVVYVDNLGNFEDPLTYTQFISNYNLGKYIKSHKIISYMHPIMIKTEDLLKIGGYAQWDMNWYPGYATDDFLPYRLWKLHCENFKFICSDKSSVYHGISMTNNTLPPNLKKKSNQDYFFFKTGMTIPQFKEKVGVGTVL